MNSEKIFVFTHHDLDGLASCLAVKWAYPEAEFDYITTTPQKFRDDYTKWLLKNKPEDFTTVYILDLDISDHVDLIDDCYITIVDHHATHVDKQNYVIANPIVQDSTSTCLLLYKYLTRLDHRIEFTREQKVLILMADDYDSFKLRIDDTIILNTVFWATQNNFDTFMDLYEDGFNGFTDQQMALYRIQRQELEKIVQGLEFYENDEVSFGGKDYRFIATFADKYIDEVCDHILKTYETDVVVVINKKTKHVSFRRYETSDINLGEFAERIASGGGHPFAAGGELLTKEMLAFTQSLKPRKKLKRRRDTE